ncbi:hypothetical protein [Amycolatopsis orientalis]|uniref:hypothetical protein n=1 Tax=Amycolatopsis orientalis TaxID=31958 RepID=UPI00040EE82A|nr:hypothetical protein [Amycolatopsis orientalis]
MKTPGRRWSALLPLLIALPVLAVPGVAQAETARDCFDGSAAITVEENRLTATLPSGGPAVGPELVRLAGFDKLVSDFTTRLCATKTASRAEKLAETAGDGLWRTAVDRAQGRRPDLGGIDKADDRPLYWARLQMSKALRQWTPRFPLTAPARANLLKTFDLGARGLDDARFPLGPSLRRVLVSGFDPFTLNGAGVRIANPSGAAALHLDGKVIQTPAGPALVQAVSFPVVWSYFDAGIVEAAYGEALKNRFRRPELIMTISQGRPGRFDIERWAGAWRGGFPDNLDASVVGQVPPASGWPQPAVQFIETTLPYEKMLAAPAGAYQVLYNQAFCVWPDSTKPGTGTAVCRTDAPKPGEIAASGGGGNYLSNESMYRSNRLRTGLGLDGVAGGHLHTPVLGTPADPAALTDADFEARRAAISAQIVTLLTAALGGTAPTPAPPATPTTPTPGASPRADVLAVPGTTL